jgi:hypothetical protein
VAGDRNSVWGLEVFCASIQDALIAPSFAVKQQILQLVIDRIVVEDTRIVIKHPKTLFRPTKLGSEAGAASHDRRKDNRLHIQILGRDGIHLDCATLSDW